MIVPGETKVKARGGLLMAQRGMGDAPAAATSVRGDKTNRGIDIALHQI
ncbi:MULTISPECIES: hypothetical protein [Paraburkholderia]|nr:MULTISPECIES: hypothetical protein [Paraburkholderia]MDH6150301.1 hypothetical protein [Paraburkholderia sp. WSM4179]